MNIYLRGSVDDRTSMRSVDEFVPLMVDQYLRSNAWTILERRWQANFLTIRAYQSLILTLLGKSLNDLHVTSSLVYSLRLEWCVQSTSTVCVKVYGLRRECPSASLKDVNFKWQVSLVVKSAMSPLG